MLYPNSGIYYIDACIQCNVTIFFCQFTDIIQVIKYNKLLTRYYHAVVSGKNKL